MDWTQGAVARQTRWFQHRRCDAYVEHRVVRPHVELWNALVFSLVVMRASCGGAGPLEPPLCFARAAAALSSCSIPSLTKSL